MAAGARATFYPGNIACKTVAISSEAKIIASLTSIETGSKGTEALLPCMEADRSRPEPWMANAKV